MISPTNLIAANADAYCFYSRVTTGSQGEDQEAYWDIPLDQDLLETIYSLYPEWFSAVMAEEEALLNLQDAQNNTPSGSPQASVDEGSLQKAMDKNKASLNVKLSLRRPIYQLVEQGLIPRKF